MQRIARIGDATRTTPSTRAVSVLHSAMTATMAGVCRCPCCTAIHHMHAHQTQLTIHSNNRFTRKNTCNANTASPLHTTNEHIYQQYCSLRNAGAICSAHCDCAIESGACVSHCSSTGMQRRRAGKADATAYSRVQLLMQRHVLRAFRRKHERMHSMRNHCVCCHC